MSWVAASMTGLSVTRSLTEGGPRGCPRSPAVPPSSGFLTFGEDCRRAPAPCGWSWVRRRSGSHGHPRRLLGGGSHVSSKGRAVWGEREAGAEAGHVLQHCGKGKVLDGVWSPLVPGCRLHFLLVIFKLFLISAEVTPPYRGENPTTEMQLGRGCLGGAPRG